MERVLAQRKALLRFARARTVPELWQQIGRLLGAICPDEGSHYIRQCGH